MCHKAYPALDLFGPFPSYLVLHGELFGLISFRVHEEISLGAAVVANGCRSRARRSGAVAQRRAKRTLDRMSSAGRRERSGAQREISLGEPELPFLPFNTAGGFHPVSSFRLTASWVKISFADIGPFPRSQVLPAYSEPKFGFFLNVPTR